MYSNAELTCYSAQAHLLPTCKQDTRKTCKHGLCLAGVRSHIYAALHEVDLSCTLISSSDLTLCAAAVYLAQGLEGQACAPCGHLRRTL